MADTLWLTILMSCYLITRIAPLSRAQWAGEVPRHPRRLA
ncbi:MAG TPA: hypothetical protein DEF41_03770 [Desulfovibrio sp.]|uniref:Uncharacterized protein n=1 Tax=Nitratidesulfovibrio vulgaris (strain ATCC 29579 / DSM 644 / CCUG 34227 / NCIMB 8303 / VKM B-1760 / Hildenborough) TaxID=882 RepID=Q72DE3_NITV2|nr:hypothetical protein DVU_0986 [Nitratidesulfovibrio vulgaris str. Hildenborough]HBW15261.1 hypothetical protein [Desulfovibrio sp.]